MFKYLGVVFTSDGRQDEELNVPSGKASAAMPAIEQGKILVIKNGSYRERQNSGCLSQYLSPSSLTYGHESKIITERLQLQMQASEMRVLRKLKGVTMFDKLRKTAIRESLNIELLLFWIEKSQLRWFGHANKMPQERLHKQILCAEVSGKRPVG